MAASPSTTVLQHLCRLVATEQIGRLPDAELLDRFALRHEEAAFTALMRRHGPLVLGVCRRVLPNWHDAEDAFQATFLVLARKARSVIKQESVGSWLYQVAYRTALRIRARKAGRQQRERQAGRSLAADTLAEVTGRELLVVLDEELNRLTSQHRMPLVLCYLQGLTRDQAARQLGWSVSTLKHRLDQARERLRDRLARRGLALPAALLAAGLAEGTARTAVPAKLLDVTVQSVRLAAAGNLGAAGAVSGPAALARQTLQAMAGSRLKVAALVLAVGGALLSVGALLHQAPARQKDRASASNAPTKAPAKQPERPAAPPASEQTFIRGRVLDKEGRPLAQARAALLGLRRGTTRLGMRLLDDKILGRARAGADGRFRLSVSRKRLAPYERLYLLAGAAGHGSVWQEVKQGGARAETVVRLPEEKIIRGRVRDLQGLPAAGIEVRVSWLGKSGPGGSETRLGELSKGSAPLWPARATTTRDGRFSLRGLNPDLHGYLHTAGDRFAFQYKEIKAGAGKVQEVSLVLAPAQLIEGIVTAADSGKPLAHALVSVNSDNNPDAPFAMGPGVSGQADARGRFRLNPPTGKMFTVRAQLAEGEPYLRVEKSFKWRGGVVRHEVKLALPRGVLIRGKVTEAASGKPVAGAVIRDTMGLWVNPTVSTRPDGTFQIAVPPGRGHLLVKGPGNDYIPLEITHGELEGGKPSGSRLYPDAVVPFQLKAGAGVHKVSVRLRRGVTIRGRLEGPDGQAPREALLLCWSQVPQHAPIWFAASVHLTDGRFELRGCDPEKTYTVHFLDAAKERGATVRLSVKKAAGKPVIVRLGPCGSAEARFVDKQGKPLPTFRPIFYIVARLGTGAAGQGISADSDFVANVDRLHYSGGGGIVDARGRCRYPALIPGATYRILGNNFRSVKDFRVKPGERLKLPDIVIPNPP
jgi:RNA polymerase sigma factor (sigma-70 family)